MVRVRVNGDTFKVSAIVFLRLWGPLEFQSFTARTKQSGNIWFTNKGVWITFHSDKAAEIFTRLLYFDWLLIYDF